VLITVVMGLLVINRCLNDRISPVLSGYNELIKHFEYVLCLPFIGFIRMCINWLGHYIILINLQLEQGC